MGVEGQSSWSELRQGDICELETFPHWVLDKTFTVAGPKGIAYLQIPGMEKVLPAVSAPGRRLVVVCSYDCDLENPRERKGVLLAPVFALKETDPRAPDILASGYLKKNEVGEETFNYLQLFPLGVEGLTPVETPHGVADFSAMTSVGKAADVTPYLLERKVAEMDNDERIRFRTKLATFIGRPTKISAS